MSDIVIQVENLSKFYRLGVVNTGTLSHDLNRWWARFRGKPDPTLRVDQVRKRIQDPTENTDDDGYIWALKDVNFEVKQGEVLGIIGRNGAGKSTLLKVLSRITAPTTGECRVKGRIASLLEVGTGFHPELTGKENVYMNGAILGMKKKEIDDKFDEIVDFSGVEQFINTPVKRYSSGMYVRLAFAVAAHLEPEILLVDEVLAVGDASFQKKCLGKMGDVAKEGRTILFVSHNMIAVRQLCGRGMVFDGGKVHIFRTVEEAVRNYIESVQAIVFKTNLANRTDRKGSQWLKFTRIAIIDAEGNELTQVTSGQDIRVRFHYRADEQKRNAVVLVGFNVKSNQGYLLANLNSSDTGHNTLDIYPQGYLECCWSKFQLRSGTYDCDLFCSVDGEIVDWLQSAFTISVMDGNYYGTGKLIERNHGDILIDHWWVSGSTADPSENDHP